MLCQEIYRVEIRSKIEGSPILCVKIGGRNQIGKSVETIRELDFLGEWTGIVENWPTTIR